MKPGEIDRRHRPPLTVIWFDPSGPMLAHAEIGWASFTVCLSVFGMVHIWRSTSFVESLAIARGLLLERLPTRGPGLLRWPVMKCTSTTDGSTCCTWWRVSIYGEPKPPGFAPRPGVYAVADGEPVEPGLVRMLRRGAPDWYGGDEQ